VEQSLVVTSTVKYAQDGYRGGLDRECDHHSASVVCDVNAGPYVVAARCPLGQLVEAFSVIDDGVGKSLRDIWRSGLGNVTVDTQ
jgi:hypothetical protein